MADLNALAADMIAAREAKDECEAALKEANRRYEEADAALFDAMVDAGLSKIAANGYTFSPDVKDYYRVEAAHMDEFHAVMERLGRGGIFKLTANPQTVQATLRELAADDAEGGLPPELADLVSVFNKQKCNMRKAAVRP